MGELAPLGPPGGARGVDDRWRRRPRRAAVARSATVSSLTSAPAAISSSRSSCSRQRCSSAGSRSRAAEIICSNAVGLDDDGARGRVGQDPLGLLGRGGLVDRHHDRADGPQRVVDQRPLVAGVRHERHPVAGRDAGRDEPLGERVHLVPELLGGDVPPAAGAVLAAQHDSPGLLGRAARRRRRPGSPMQGSPPGQACCTRARLLRSPSTRVYVLSHAGPRSKRCARHGRRARDGRRRRGHADLPGRHASVPRLRGPYPGHLRRALRRRARQGVHRAAHRRAGSTRPGSSPPGSRPG